MASRSLSVMAVTVAVRPGLPRKAISPTSSPWLRIVKTTSSPSSEVVRALSVPRVTR